jgi:AcrR family transcriptional regulator
MGTQDRAEPSPVRAVRSDARHRNICAAALALFSDRGFAETRIEDIADRARVAKGTVLTHFPSKEALLAQVVVDMSAAVVERIAAAAQLDATPDDRIATVAAALHQELRYPERGALPWLVVRDACVCDGLVRRLDRELRERVREVVAGVIRDGMASGHFRDGDAVCLADMLIDPLVLRMMWWHAVGRHAADAACGEAQLDEACMRHRAAFVALLLVHPS